MANARSFKASSSAFAMVSLLAACRAPQPDIQASASTDPNALSVTSTEAHEPGVGACACHGWPGVCKVNINNCRQGTTPHCTPSVPWPAGCGCTCQA